MISTLPILTFVIFFSIGINEGSTETLFQPNHQSHIGVSHHYAKIKTFGFCTPALLSIDEYASFSINKRRKLRPIKFTGT